MTTITALPTPPSRDDPANFATRADDFLGALPTFVTQTNTVAGEVNANASNASTYAGQAYTYRNVAEEYATTASTKAFEAAASALTAVNAPGTSATSSSSVTVGTGAKTLIINPSKNFVKGMEVVIARTSAPATTKMVGTVTLFDGFTGQFDVNVTYAVGSGSYTDWTISLTAAADLSSFAAKASENTFTANQTINANLTVSGNLGVGGTSAVARLEIVGTTYQGSAITQTRTSVGQWTHLVTGTGSLLFRQGNAESTNDYFRIDPSGGVLVISPAGLGYGTGAGGTVTQSTSKTTAVTLNKPTGAITMHNAALAAGASVTFQLQNSLASASDILILTGEWGTVDPRNYRIECSGFASGSPNFFYIKVTNISAGSLAEALKINFAIIKGATS